MMIMFNRKCIVGKKEEYMCNYEKLVMEKGIERKSC